MWPKTIVDIKPSNALKEAKVKNNSRIDPDNTMLFRCVEMPVNSKVDKVTSVWRLQPEKFSSWKRLTRTQAWVMRFISNCRVSENERLLDQELHSEEVIDVEGHIVRTMQREVFYEEYSALIKKHKFPKQSKLFKLYPQLDDDETMRSDG